MSVGANIFKRLKKLTYMQILNLTFTVSWVSARRRTLKEVFLSLVSHLRFPVEPSKNLLCMVDPQ